MKTTLYKLNASNNISWWKIELKEDTYSISWGQDLNRINDHSQNHNTYIAPTPREAEEQVRSRIEHQIKRVGYSEEIPKTRPDRPMLAQKWEDHHEKVATGARQPFQSIAIQPKLDGMRCIATSKKLVSRRNDLIVSVPHIQFALGYLQDHKVDGELYIHNTDLQTVMSFCKRNTPRKDYNLVEYHIFDIVDEELPFKERYNKLSKIILELQEAYRECREEFLQIPHGMRGPGPLNYEFPIKLVPTLFFEMQSDSAQFQHLLKQYHKQWRKENYEGVIVRNAEAPYEIDYRSPDLLKYKEYLDDEFEIIDIHEGYGNTGIFVCRTEAGQVFEATPAWTNEAKRKLLRRKEHYIGRWVTVTYEKLSRDGVPLKPIGGLTYESKRN